MRASVRVAQERGVTPDRDQGPARHHQRHRPLGRIASADWIAPDLEIGRRVDLQQELDQLVVRYGEPRPDIGQPLATLRADGGASGNAFLMQMQADLANRPVHAAEVEEIGALGVAGMAMAAVGGTLVQAADATVYTPLLPEDQRHEARSRWAAAIRQAKV